LFAAMEKGAAMVYGKLPDVNVAGVWNFIVKAA
jgi:hypothetical protein